jgi:hypothetical protein
MFQTHLCPFLEPGIMDIFLSCYAWKEPNHLTLSYAARQTVATNDSELHSLTPETLVLQPLLAAT